MDELPVHRVTFSRPFWMAKTEVTMQQYEQFKKVDHTPDPNEVEMPKGAIYPVVWVSWYDARDFCAWLTQKERRRGRLPEGYEYVLPTEAQWEYACRAGTTEDFAGNPDQMAWYKKNSGGKTNPVGKKKPNAWGLYDMHGNVWEWCDDIWYANYINAPVDGSQRGDAPNEYTVDRSLWGQGAKLYYRLYNDHYRVVRGGSWAYSKQACRSANRYYHTPKYKLSYLGFRPILIWNPPALRLKVMDRLEGIPTGVGDSER
jgi:formylglycine-generating enzyme required for sulfatase activity